MRGVPLQNPSASRVAVNLSSAYGRVTSKLASTTLTRTDRFACIRSGETGSGLDFIFFLEKYLASSSRNESITLPCEAESILYVASSALGHRGPTARRNGRTGLRELR